MVRKPCVIICVRLSPPEAERLDVAALATGRTRSSVVRQVLTLLETPEVRKTLGVVGDPALIPAVNL